MTPNPIVGGLYFVADETLTLLPEALRTLHEVRRPVLVLSGSETNADSDWPFVLAAPVSGSTGLKTRFCVKLAAGEGGATKKCWVRIPAVQPLNKSDLEDRLGVVNEKKLEECHVRLVEYLGLIGAA